MNLNFYASDFLNKIKDIDKLKLTLGKEYKIEKDEKTGITITRYILDSDPEYVDGYYNPIGRFGKRWHNEILRLNYSNEWIFDKYKQGKKDYEVYAEIAFEVNERKEMEFEERRVKILSPKRRI